MSKLKELIDKLCPDGVEYKKLGDVCFFADGLPIKADDIKEQGLYPVIKIGNIINGIVVEQKHYLTELPPKIKKSQILEGGEILVGMSGSTGKTGYNSLQNAVVNQRIAIIRNSDLVLNGYLKHCLVNNNFESYCFQIGNGPQHNISKFDLLAFEIPLPPIEVQEEIVRILDNFTKCTAELQAELQAREEQYEYYRNKLLSFEGRTDVEYKKLGEVCLFMNGKGHEKNIVENGKYIVVNSKFISTQGTIRKYSDIQISPLFIDSVLMVMSDLPNGKALAKCFIVDKNDVYTLNQRICSLTIKNTNKLLPKYLFYITNRNRQLLKYDNGVDQTNLRKEDILNILIPIPTLTEQQRIVDILDRFDILVNDISQGLPAELEARQNQYEYYRNKLLTFDKILSA